MKFYKDLPISISKIFLAAILISMLFVFQDFASYKIRGLTYDFSWLEISVKSLSSNLTWAVLSPIVYWLSTRISFKSILSTLKGIGIALAISFSQTLLYLLLFATFFLINDGIWMNLLEPDNMAVIAVGTLSGIVQLAFLMAIFMFFDYYKRYLEKQKELNNAQLYALKMKLHPHFLFNTLHAISSMVDYNKEGAQKMLTRLGSLFRTILEHEQEQTISLEQELKYIQDYLEIEQVRFEEQLEIKFDVADDTLDASVPSLILQPLVENSIKHGISKMKERGRITIQTKRILNGKAGRIALTVSDNGMGFGNSRQKNFGIGIKNVNDRLERLYNEDFHFKIGEGEERGAVVEIEIPYLKKEQS